jgi:glycosyltransferase involved in cell wall biosynthesis
MHILITADTVGGVWTYTRELVTGLAQHGFRITLVSFGKIPRAAQTQWLERLANVDFRPTAFRLEWMQDAASDIEESTEYLRDVIKDVKPELLHLNQYCYGGIEIDVPRVVVAHSDVISWSVTVYGSEPEPGDWINWYRRVVTKGLAGADVVVAPSQTMLDNARCYFGVQHGRVIYNGRTPALFDCQTQKENAVLSVGRIWDEAKNTALLLDAKPDLPVWIVGTSANPDSGGTAELRSAGHIEFKGELSEPELRHLYARAGIYAATSQYEPFGLAPVEAAFSGCAIVANDIPTFHELWGDSVFYFRRNDASSLREALHELGGNQRRRQQFGKLAYDRARLMFTADRMIDEYMELYRSLIAQNRAGHRAQVAGGAELVS